MGFRRSDLQPAFSTPGTCDFTVWGYGTTDSLEDILRPGYLQGGRALVDLGDLIFVRMRPRRDRPDGRPLGELRAALLMVSGLERGDVRLRLVQDFGRPDDPGPSNGRAATSAAASPAEAPPKRKRGRPPGSRTRKIT